MKDGSASASRRDDKKSADVKKAVKVAKPTKSAESAAKPAGPKKSGAAPAKGSDKSSDKSSVKGASKPAKPEPKVAKPTKGDAKVTKVDAKPAKMDAKAAKGDGKPVKGAKAATPEKSVKLSAKALKALKAAAAKPPPPPPRKIVVVQLTTLKEGARGTKASVPRAARTPDVVEKDTGPPIIAKKRRSAELTPQQLDHFRELLNQRRVRLASDLGLMQDEALKVHTQDNSSDSVADTGTDNYEQDFTLGLIESEEALAREVGDALVRIEHQAFGVCESCQTPIPLARLEILPFSRCCVECQQKRESSV